MDFNSKTAAATAVSMSGIPIRGYNTNIQFERDRSTRKYEEPRESDWGSVPVGNHTKVRETQITKAWWARISRPKKQSTTPDPAKTKKATIYTPKERRWMETVCPCVIMMLILD